MAKTRETAAHLGAAERCGATSRLRHAARRMVRRPTHRRLRSRCEEALPRRSVDGEAPRVARWGPQRAP